jgi:hypothetical protein
LGFSAIFEISEKFWNFLQFIKDFSITNKMLVNFSVHVASPSRAVTARIAAWSLGPPLRGRFRVGEQ